MALDILYFAWVREAIGKDGETVEPPADVRTVGDLVAWLAGQGAGHAEALADPAKLRAAADHVLVAMDAPIGQAKELAIFPPVTGG